MAAGAGDPGRPDRPQDGLPLDPLDALTAEPPVFGERRAGVLSPAGEFETTGDFLRGLGPRRVKILVLGLGAVLVALTLPAAL